MVLKFILAIFFGFAAMAHAQVDQGGFLAPGDSLRGHLPHAKNIYLPAGGFTLLDMPKGNFKGKVLPGPPLGTGPGTDTLLATTLMGTNIRPRLLTADGYFETMDERYYLAFDQQQEGYVRVLGDSYPGWISLDEIRDKGFVLIYWLDYYGKAPGNMIHPLEKVASIRMGPGMGSPIIEVADELYSEITTLGSCEGLFCRVKVVQYNNPYDPEKTKEENVLKKYRGWIQVIDGQGKPLVPNNDQR